MNLFATEGETLKTIKLAMPWPPSVNDYWLIGQRGKQGRPMMFLGPRGRAYQIDALASILRQHGANRADRIQERVRIEITAHAPDVRKRDLDNILKPLLDALHHCNVIEDDSLIDDLRIRRGYVSRDNPRVEVLIEEIVP